MSYSLSLVVLSLFAKVSFLEGRIGVCMNLKKFLLLTIILSSCLSQGNHGEDVKECYYYLDALPTYAYARALYKYPQSAYPYSQLVEGNRSRGILDPELELEDTGAFAESKYVLLHVGLLRNFAKGGWKI